MGPFEVLQCRGLDVFRSARHKEFRLFQNQAAALQRFDEDVQFFRDDLIVGEFAVHVLDAGLEAAASKDLADDAGDGERVLSAFGWIQIESLVGSC